MREAEAAPRRYRFAYEKLGAAAFLSHLDVIRAIPRAFRRLELSLHYSRGFHPKPDMTFGPALSLGVASLCEVVDIKMAADIDPSAVLGELSCGAHAGMRFCGGVKLGSGDAAVTRMIDAARYVVGIPRTAIEVRGGEGWLRDRVGDALAARELVVMRRIDGVGKRVEVRGLLRSIGMAREASEWLERAGLVGDLVALSVDVDVRASGGVKVGEVIEAVTGDKELPYRAVRVLLGRRREDGSVVSPLKLQELREGGAAAVAGLDIS